MDYPSNTDDIIDSRDVIEAIDELTESGDDAETLATLTALAAEAADYSEDWQYGSQLISDSYFETYAQELAIDCGYFDSKNANQWPFTCIDWEQAAIELQSDYTAVEFDNVTYWVR